LTLVEGEQESGDLVRADRGSLRRNGSVSYADLADQVQAGRSRCSFGYGEEIPRPESTSQSKSTHIEDVHEAKVVEVSDEGRSLSESEGVSPEEPVSVESKLADCRGAEDPAHHWITATEYLDEGKD
jgi:hypothetical protein